MSTYTDLRSILQSIPYKALLSLENQIERRAIALQRLQEAGMEAEWMVPVKIPDIDWSLIAPAFRKSPRYGSHAVSVLALFDEAERRGVDSFMHIEDDIVFHHQFNLRLPLLMIPDDWKFIYLGGRNWGPKVKVAGGVVRSSSVCDLHAVIMRTEMIPLMRETLRDARSSCHWCDARIAMLHKKYPAYLCRPNLAWQTAHPGDSGTGNAYCNYHENGRVKQGQGN